MSEKQRTPELERIDEWTWGIPRRGGMRVPGRIFANEKLLAEVRGDPALEQVANVAHLQGIVGYSLAMPDIHWGYGFAIGGVAAVDAEEGVITPGGIGFDINCGVRLARTSLGYEEIGPHLERLADRLFQVVPAGVGSEGAIARLTRQEEKKILERGAAWAVEKGFGEAEDLAYTEEGGCLEGADPAALSDTALERGLKQIGTLGSGNHFLEVQRVDELYRPDVARALGLEVGTITVMIHCGSRGLGYQTCDDALRVMGKAMERHHIRVPDRQLACVPIRSAEGRRYLAGMACAANYAWANRQVIFALARRAFAEVLGVGPESLGFRLVYDVCHNIAKFEEHDLGGERRKVCVHRKGATRAFGPGQPAVPEALRALGQPVIIPGDMGRCSFVLVGTATAMGKSFGTTCHGAGRVMSRTQSKRLSRGLDLVAEMAKRGVLVRARGLATVAEEMPHAYKDVAEVVDVVDRAGLSAKVARLRPLAVIKG